MKPSIVLRVLLLGMTALPALLLAKDSPPAKAPASSPLPAGLEKVTSVEGITEYVLPNGLNLVQKAPPAITSVG